MRRILVNEKDEFKCQYEPKSRNFAIKKLGNFYSATEKNYSHVVVSNKTIDKEEKSFWLVKDF